MLWTMCRLLSLSGVGTTSWKQAANEMFVAFAIGGLPTSEGRHLHLPFCDLLDNPDILHEVCIPESTSTVEMGPAPCAEGPGHVLDKE
jgi:hypothetical protein